MRKIVSIIFGILFFMLIIGVFVYPHYTQEDKFYRNLDMKIVLWDYSCSTSNDKFHKPQLCNAILFEAVINGDTLYREFNTCTKPYAVHIDTEWLYNHKIGDICHFDYLQKDQFFKINKR